MEISEEQIIKTCQEGDMESFVLLYDKYVEKIYKFFYYRTSHKELTEDLTSQAFLQAMDKLSTFKTGAGTFQSWLYKIANNYLIDHYRKQKPTDSLDSHEDLASSENLESETHNKLTSQQLEKLLKELPENAREILQMRLWDELSYAEIASVTGKSEGSLKMQFTRAVASLQKFSHLLVLLLIFLKK